MKKSEKIIFIVFISTIAFFSLAIILSVLFPKISAIYGSEISWQIGKFIILLSFAISMTFLARWQFNDIEEKENKDYEEEEEEKNIWKKIIAKENKSFNGFIQIAFHSLPLYFPLLFANMDLVIGFKVVLFAYSIFAYLLVELRYLVNKLIRLIIFIRKKLKIENIFVLLGIIFFLIIFFFITTFFIGYGLVIFYINTLSEDTHINSGIWNILINML